MYNLLIVDDESEITDGIEDLLLSSDLGLKEIRKAYSAVQAMELFQKTFFDIVISDINMPEMTGLDMAEKMRISWPRLKIIFLTGFRDFEYARQALRLGSNDYLIKPVSDEQLLDSVQAVLDGLDADLNRALALHEIQESLPSLLLEKQQQYFDDVLRGNRNFSFENRKLDFCYYATSLKPLAPVTTIAVLYNQVGLIPPFRCHLMLLNAMKEILSDSEPILGILYDSDISLLLLQRGDDVAMKRVEELQSFFCDRMQITFSVGCIKRIAWEDWEQKTVNLLQALRLSGFGALLNADRDSINSANGGHTNQIADAVKSYIQNHLSGDLSLSELSIHFHINPSYLSRVFRQITGQQLSTFISYRRVEKARQLLRETDLRIAEISKTVGFDNSNYFAKVFVKQVGCTPKEYRIDLFGD